MSDEDKSEDAEKKGEAETKTRYIGFLAIGLMIGIIIGIIVGAFGFPQIQSFGAANGLTADEAGEKAVNFIENYAVPPGVDVVLINVTEVEDANLYKVAINISAMGRSETAESYLTKNGKLLFPSGIDIEEFEEKTKPETTIGNFIVSGDEICKEDGKAIIYFFGSDGCGYCKWEHPVMVNVTSKFEGFISFHDNMNNLTADMEIFDKYNPRHSMPTLVLGCKYYRIGAGKSMGEEQEAKVLTALICDLTDNKPENVCTDRKLKS